MDLITVHCRDFHAVVEHVGTEAENIEAAAIATQNILHNNAKNYKL